MKWLLLFVQFPLKMLTGPFTSYKCSLAFTYVLNFDGKRAEGFLISESNKICRLIPTGSRNGLFLGGGGPASLFSIFHCLPGFQVEMTSVFYSPGGFQPLIGAWGSIFDYLHTSVQTPENRRLDIIHHASAILTNKRQDKPQAFLLIEHNKDTHTTPSHLFGFKKNNF